MNELDDVSISRRGLLIGTTATGALLVGAFLGRGPLLRQAASSFLGNAEATPPVGDATSSPYDAWFEVPADGPTERIVLYMPKAEMGQGIHTALAQIAAEDLELRMDQLEIRPVTLIAAASGTTSRGFGGLTSTAGSSSITGSYAQLRSAANTLREMLVLEGAAQLQVKRSAVEAHEGTVRLKSAPTKILSYSTIVKNRKGALGSWGPPKTVPALKPVRSFRLIGTSAARVDSPAKITGTATYGFDVKVDGLHYGAVARPPRYNARLTKADVADAKRSPGVVSVVVDEAISFVGVVATTRKRAYDALAKVKCTWEGGSSSDDASVLAHMKTAASGFAIFKQGDGGQSLGDVNKAEIVEHQYFVPMAAHAHLEPLAAVAQVLPDVVNVWVATQQPMSVSSDVAGVLKQKRTIVLHPTYLGGGFGRKFAAHTAAEATRLSEASGKPVQVALAREEDMAMGPFRPPTLTTIRGAVKDGRIVGIDQHSVSRGLDPAVDAALKAIRADTGELPGLVTPYRAIKGYTAKVTSLDIDIPTGIWRGVGLMANTFANETFMDELASVAKANPLQFRLDHLPQDAVGKNYARLLNQVAERASWGTDLKPGQGRGIAAASMAGTIVTAVVLVTVSNTDITVNQIHLCADPGLVINPDGAKLQLAGAAMMSLSSAFGEQMHFEKGMATTTNFDSYSMLKAEKAPPIDVHLMGSGENPGGLGEPGIGPVCAALGNAIFAATGTRLRSLPFAL